MIDVKTEIECISLRLELLIDESQRLFRLLSNFTKMDKLPYEKVQKEVLERLSRRKVEIKEELETLAARVKKVIELEKANKGADSE